MTVTEVRAAVPAEVSLLAALQAACYGTETAPSEASAGPGATAATYVGEAWPARSWAEVLAMPGSFALIAAAGSEPVGFFLGQVVIDASEVLGLGVLPRHRRAGNGRLLLDAGIAAALGRGAAVIQLEVAENNRGAWAFYQSFGFGLAGRRRGYYRVASGPAVDALILRKRISAD